jgi:hypothetical protein
VMSYRGGRALGLCHHTRLNTETSRWYSSSKRWLGGNAVPSSGGTGEGNIGPVGQRAAPRCGGAS